MKVPVSWLREYVEFGDDIDVLVEKLTFAGLEVEAVEQIGSDFEGVVVGEVTAVEPHPNADKLRLCTVEFGGEAPLKVVCGAPNVRVGGKYPFARVGTTLPCGITLKKAKIRGVESLGMLCARDELGLGDDHSGLLELPEEAVPGTPFVEIWGAPETVLELEITPNRPDCLSMVGVARETAAVFGTELRRPEPAPPEGEGPSPLDVRIEDEEGCPRYTARLFEGVRIAPSPEWMQRRLEAAGIRPINNVVDITNYVMLETGHPLHAFDADLLEGESIVIRRARPGEKILTLDGVERTLDESMTVIADARRPVAVAGVMGGEKSGTSDETTRVVLEAAAFDPARIRQTAKKLGLSTDSSYRFQRGVSPQQVEWAARRAAELICELAGGRPVGEAIDLYPRPQIVPRIPFRRSRIAGLLGIEIDPEEIRRILQALEIGIEEDEGDAAVAVPPPFRLDLEREVDLAEEIARIHGLDKVPENIPLARVVPGAGDDRVRALRTLHEALRGLGATEIMNYTLVNHALLDLFNPDDRPEREELPHPISAEQSVLRTSLLPQMVETLGRNHSRQVEKACFYEIGRVFRRRDGAPVQDETVAVGMMGPVGRPLLQARAPVKDEEMFGWMKGFVERLLAARRVKDVSFEPADRPEYEPGCAVEVKAGGEIVGHLGLVNRRARNEWRLSGPTAVAELRIEPLLEHVFDIPRVEEPAPYPAVSRDIALVVDEAVTHAEVMRLVEKARPDFLESVTLFDVYRGKNIGKGRKSLAYSFVYRSPRQTLTDKKVNKIHRKLTDFLCRELNAALREE